jgi:hypothetical protein
MIRKSLKHLIRWANTHYERDDNEVLVDMTGSKLGRGIGSDGMNFTLYNATGGYVLEYRRYDKKTERQDTKLHIINHDDDLGEKIGQIISLEILRN